MPRRRVRSEDTLPLLQQLLADKSEEVRRAATDAALGSEVPAEFVDAVLQQLYRIVTPLKAWEVDFSDLAARIATERARR